ncbi:MAG: molybdopterin-guanine dinucleotide biosynthesis protein B [Chloroflexi bacterium]|nr:molybdopterin-guanine dinucleotide biosynthesis protein B [Chloroflexota bacterium]
MVPIIAFVGKSGSGKTTLLEQVVRDLKGRGLRVAVAKHTHHRVTLDEPGKDSWRYAAAGSDVVLLNTPQGFALFDYGGQDVPLAQAAAQLEGRVDLLLAEGYKWAPVPKIAVVRAAVSQELPCPAGELLAAVTDLDLPLAVPLFAFSETDAIADFVIAYACRWAAPASEETLSAKA